MTIDIDWSNKDHQEKPLIYCRCGSTYYSHAKTIFGDDLKIYTRECCPNCGQNENNSIRISYSPEIMTIDSDGY